MDRYEKSDKKVRFGNKYNIKVTTYYLGKHKSGLRMEVKRFTHTRTVEIELLMGDDVLTLKTVYQRKVLQSPTKKEVDQVLKDFIQYAKDKGFKMIERGTDEC
jgi:transaldolase